MSQFHAAPHKPLCGICETLDVMVVNGIEKDLERFDRKPKTQSENFTGRRELLERRRAKLHINVNENTGRERGPGAKATSSSHSFAIRGAGEGVRPVCAGDMERICMAELADAQQGAPTGAL